MRVLITNDDGIDSEGLHTLAAVAVEQGHDVVVAAPSWDSTSSGVNQGPNTGHAVLHSGTVGAAFTAATFGLPAMAVSLTVRDAPLWETAAAIVRVVLPWATELEPPSVLNVNVPAVDVAELRPLQVATLAPFGAVQTTITERGEGYLKLGYTEISAEADGDTDAGLLARGVPCYTILRAVCEVSAPAGR